MDAVREWLDGRPVPRDDLAWSVAVTGSLGCGYRVGIPYGAADLSAVTHAHDRAARVATLFGAELDESGWRELLGGPPPDRPLTVTGVWEPVFRGPLGTPRTRVQVHPPEPDRTAVAVRLPWTHGTSTATAGEPVLAVHEEALATAHLFEVADDAPAVGLWLDDAERLCTSTAGPLLAYDPARGWTHPGPERRAVGHWLHDRLTEELGSEPTEQVGVTDGVFSLWAVAESGALTSVGRVDPDAEAALLRARRRLLPLR